jgi:hypothetical protein
MGLVRGDAGPAEATVEMHCVPERSVRSIIAAAGVEVADVQLTNSTDLTFVFGEQVDSEELFAVGGLQYLDAEPTIGFVSKQYCAIKPAEATP